MNRRNEIMLDVTPVWRSATSLTSVSPDRLTKAKVFKVLSDYYIPINLHPSSRLDKHLNRMLFDIDLITLKQIAREITTLVENKETRESIISRFRIQSVKTSKRYKSYLIFTLKNKDVSPVKETRFSLGKKFFKLFKNNPINM